MDKKYCPYCMNPITPGEPCASCGLTEGTYAPSPHHLPPGTVLAGRYLIGRVLGEGGFGITYIGCDLRLELRVAIKEYYPHDRVNRNSKASLTVTGYTGNVGKGFDAGRERFIQEARVMARMDKTPQIVAVRDFFQENNTAYIVMEYVDGTTFKELVAQKGGRISALELLPLVEPLFSALSAMHALGLIHRDISPDNLMLENGGVRLLDFGCARESAQGVNTMTIVLKHGYSPIEQYQHKGQGPWTDVYSLSATLYYCLTGKTPPQALDRICGEELTPPRQLGADLTPAQEKAILRGMGMRRSQRFPSVERLHAALYKGVDVPVEAFEDEPSEPVQKAVEQPDPVPVTVPAAEPDDGRSPVFEPEPAAEAWPASAPEPVAAGQAKLPPILDFIKARWPIAAGAGAALVLLIALLVWHPWTGTPTVDDAGEPSAGQSEPVSQTSQSPAQTAQAVPTSFSEEQTADENGLVLLAMLADDSLDEVTIPKDVPVEVFEHVTLTKTLRVEGSEYAWTCFHSGLTVADGGRLQTWCNMGVSALLRIMDGGTVSVESGGRIDTHIIWQDREGSLTAAPDGRVNVWGGQDPTKGPLNDLYAYSHYMVLDEEALFANAVPVSSDAEFAANCQGNSPIVINGEVTLTEWHVAAVPILIPEGAVLIAPCNEFYGDCSLDVDCTVVVNRGALRGRVSLMDYSADRMQANPRLINYGTVGATLNAYGGSASTIINYGEIKFADSLCGGSELDQAAISNLGRMVTPRGVQVDQHGNVFENAGTFCVSDGTWSIWGGANLWNCGAIAVEDGGRLVNHGNLSVEYGTLEASPGGATVENYSRLDVDQAEFVLQKGAVFHNDGIVIHGSDSLSFSKDASVNGGGRMVPFSWHETWGDSIRYVENERDLRQALANPSVDVVIWNGYQDYNRIELTGGDLEITKGVCLSAPGEGYGGDGTIRGGDITVTGENAFLFFDNIDFGGSSGLRVENGACVWQGGTDPHLDSLTVDSGGLYVSTSFATVSGPVTLSGGGRLVNSGSMDLQNGPVTIGEGSAMENYTGIALSNAAVTNDGELTVMAGHLEQNGGSLTNRGLISLGYGPSPGYHMTGTVSNHGEINFGGNGGGELNGQIVNETDGVIRIEGDRPEHCPVVRGTLDNQGLIRVTNGGDLYTDGGRVTGNLVTYQ